MGVVAGNAVIVNTDLAGNQSAPSIAALANGGWVISWTSTGGVVSQIYNANGSKSGGEIHVSASAGFGNVVTTGLEDGGWLLTYDATSIGYDRDIYQLRYNADGTVNGSATSVVSYTPPKQYAASTTMLADGGWVTTWTADGTQNNFPGIGLQRFNSDGSMHGNAVLVNTGTYGSFFDSHVAALADGGWLATWTTHAARVLPGGEIIAERNVWAQLYNADGTTRGSNFDIEPSLDVNFAQSEQEITGLANGGFVVSYSLLDNTTTIIEAMVRVFDANGNAVTDPIIAPASSFGSQNATTITALDNGGFVMTWQATLDVVTGMDIYCQAFNADGTKSGSQIRVNVDTADTQGFTSITALAGSSWVIAWQDKSGGDADIMQRTFKLVNDAPAGSNATFEMVENTSHTFSAADFGFSDADGNGFAGIVISAIPEHGSLTLNNVAVVNGAFIAAADFAKLKWTPDVDDFGNGLGSLSFRVKDNGGTDNSGQDTDQSANTLTFNVHNVNQAPTAANLFGTMLEEGSYTFKTADFGFSDAGDTVPNNLAKIIITANWNYGGTLYFKGDEVGFGGLTIDAAEIGQLVFVGSEDYSGEVLELDFKLVDDGGTAYGGQDTSAETNWFRLDATQVNDAPYGGDVTVDLDEDVEDAIQDRFWFSDSVDGDAHDLSAVIIDEIGGKGTFKLAGVAVTAGQVITKAELKDLIFVGDKDDFGDGYATLTYRVRDNGGTENGGIDTEATSHTLTFNLDDVVDRFAGTKAKNTLLGTDGQDILDGKGGNDRLTGEDGVDTFVFKKNYDKDVITDFLAMGDDHDILDIRGLSSVRNFSDLRSNHMDAVKGGVLIDGLSGDEIMLTGVKIKDLDKGDFLI